MSKNKKPAADGIVYSTNPGFQMRIETGSAAETAASNEQKLTVRLETKHRAGKAVSILRGYIGKIEDLEELGKKLKNFCGTGGAVKDGEIIIQGDQRDKMLQWLLKNGYAKAKRI
ncbi:MAG: translation initiation factor [Chitinophagaceae bacterium]